MNRRDFLNLAAGAPAVSIAGRVEAARCDLMVELVAELFRQRDAYELIPDPSGDGDSPAHDAAWSELVRLEAEIDAHPVNSREGVAAYCRYLAKEAELLEIEPWQFDKIIDWAAGGEA